MGPKAKLWTGITLLIIIAFNYTLIGFPMFSKSSSIAARAKSIAISQAKAKNIFQKTDDEYILQLLRKEQRSIDRNILILNAVAATLTFVIISWTVFGILFHRRK
ncbi:MAG: hypothetical protein PHP46_01650 [Candidatus Omnitrophica bacterium]|nr:hypothetical protein [Candidatus Omnitrophota bacterium]